MIRVGQEPRLTWGAKRAAAASGGMAAILVIGWILRGTLGIERYVPDMLVATFTLIFLAFIFNARTNSGAARALSSLLGNLTGASVVVILLIWFMQWIELAGVPPSLADLVPDLAVLALVSGLGAFAAHQFRPRGETLVSTPLFSVRAGQGPVLGQVKVAAKRDAVGAVVRKSGRTIGCVILGDLSASFATPMGTVNASLAGPVTAAWVPFEGEKLSNSEAQKMAGKTTAQLLQDARTGAAFGASFTGAERVIDLPFVHVEDNGFDEVAEIGPLRVSQNDESGRVKIGPVSIDSDSAEDRGRWYMRGAGDTYFRGSHGRVSAKWNGSSMSFDGSSMKLRSGSDSFSYTPAEITTQSPMHSLRVTQDKVSLDTNKFTLKVSGDTVMLRAEDKTQTTESKQFAGDIRALLTETVKRQVREVMEGVPIDLNEMLTATEKVLTRHG